TIGICVLLEAFAGVAESVIEELVEQAQQLHLTVEFDWALQKALALKEVPEILLRHYQRPAEAGQRNPLGGTTRANDPVAALDVAFRAGEQPLAEVVKDFVNPGAQLLGRNLLQILGAGGIFQFRNEALGELIGMRFDQTD